MLVLTRQTEQSLVIGDNVVVTVLEIRGDSVRIGIQAPREIGVYREEVFAEIQQANRSSATTPESVLGRVGKLREVRDAGGSPITRKR